MGLLAACQSLAADLTAAGVPASVERAKVPTPGAWISPVSVDVQGLDVTPAVARVDVFLVAGDLGDVASIAALSDLLDLALDRGHLVPLEPVETNFRLSLPHTSTPLPAFRLAVDIDL